MALSSSALNKQPQTDSNKQERIRTSVRDHIPVACPLFVNLHHFNMVGENDSVNLPKCVMPQAQQHCACHEI